MAYQGISPRIYQQNNLTNVQLIDDISSQFNGTTTTFTMTSGGDTFHAVASRAIFIVLGGIVQEPDVDYTTTGDEITFTTAPVSGLTFAGRKIYGLNKLEGINDGLVTPSKLSLGGPSWDTNNNLSVSGNITQTGDTNNIIINTDTPTVRPTLDLNFERDQRLDSRITFTRSSTATYLGSDGLIKTALADQPRFDFDINGNCLGLLIEESRTNLFTYSEEFDNSAWSKIRTTVSANSIIAPDGTLTADKIIEGVGTSQDYILDENASSSIATYTYSFFAKAGERSHIRVSRSTGNQTTFIHYYTLENNGTATGGGNIVAYPNGWYRCYGQTEVTSAGSAGFAIRLENSSTNSIYNGDGSSGFYIWGAQYEQGAFATSYIPTSGSTVTRTVDNAKITGTNFTDWYNASEGTIFTESRLYSLTSTQNFTEIQIDDGTQSNRIFHYIAQVDDKGKFQAWGADTITPNTATPGIDFKHSSSYNSQSYITCLDGQLSSEGNTGTQVSLTEAKLGYNHSNNYLNGYIKRLTYYPKRLSNVQLQNLTK